MPSGEAPQTGARAADTEQEQEVEQRQDGMKRLTAGPEHPRGATGSLCVGGFGSSGKRLETADTPLGP